MKAHPVLATALAALALALAGCGGARGAEPAPRPPAHDAAEFEALYRARADSARMRFTPADVEFMTAMLGHHAQAILISRLAPGRAESGAVRTLAARIINAQRDEIATIERWLRDRGQPVPEIHIDTAAGELHGMGHGAHGMAGMLTPEQIRELQHARGADFDRLFLTYMIQHHRGALEMVERRLALAEAVQDEELFKFASDVHVDQITEIERMQRMLEAMEGP